MSSETEKSEKDTDHAEQTKEVKQGRPKRRIPLEYVALFIASCGVVAAFLQWRIYVSQWKVMSEQLNDARAAAADSAKTTAEMLKQITRSAAAAESASGATQTAADAAKSAANTARAALFTAQRATLQVVGGVTPGNLNLVLPQTFTVAFQNSGHSQATNVTAISTWAWDMPDVIYPVGCFRPFVGPDEIRSQSDVGAGQVLSVHGKLLDNEGIRAALGEAREGRRHAFVCGEVKYTDAFGHDWKRFFCQRFNQPTASWVNCSVGNREISVK